jgi:hypothetical protein
VEGDLLKRVTHSRIKSDGVYVMDIGMLLENSDLLRFKVSNAVIGANNLLIAEGRQENLAYLTNFSAVTMMSYPHSD